MVLNPSRGVSSRRVCIDGCGPEEQSLTPVPGTNYGLSPRSVKPQQPEAHLETLPGWSSLACMRHNSHEATD